MRSKGAHPELSFWICPCFYIMLQTKVYIGEWELALFVENTSVVIKKFTNKSSGVSDSSLVYSPGCIVVFIGIVVPTLRPLRVLSSWWKCISSTIVSLLVFSFSSSSSFYFFLFSSSSFSFCLCASSYCFLKTISSSSSFFLAISFSFTFLSPSYNFLSFLLLFFLKLFSFLLFFFLCLVLV